MVIPTNILNDKSIKSLDLSNNLLTILPGGFGHASSVPHIEVLYLNNYQLTSLSNGFGQILPNLEELFLYDNQLTSLPDGFGQNLPNLEELFLYDNQ